MEMTLSLPLHSSRGRKEKSSHLWTVTAQLWKSLSPNWTQSLIWHSHQSQPYQCGKANRSSHVPNQLDLHQQISQITGNSTTWQHAWHSGNRSLTCQMWKGLIILSVAMTQLSSAQLDSGRLSFRMTPKSIEIFDFGSTWLKANDFCQVIDCLPK